MMGWKWYSVMNHKPLLGEEKMPEHLFGSGPVKHKDDCHKETSTFPLDLGMVAINSLLNVQVCSETMGTFLITLVKSRIDDEEIISQDEHESCHRLENLKAFL